MSYVRGIYRWTDCGYLCGYRIQVHHRHGNYRLLDPKGHTLERGSRAACQQALAGLANSQGLEHPRGRMVLLLHGLGRNAWSMSSMSRYLQRTWPGTEVIAYQYASTAANVTEHARHFIEFMAYSDQASEVNFVAHSLGNIVLRRAFRLAELGQWQLPKLGRHVMLGPPNQGSQSAQRTRWIKPLAWFAGPPFKQLGVGWQNLEPELAVPPCPFGIVAGRIRFADSLHPILDGPSDLIVRVPEAELPGAADFLVVSELHSNLMNNRNVQAKTLHFLKSGHFE